MDWTTGGRGEEELRFRVLKRERERKSLGHFIFYRRERRTDRHKNPGVEFWKKRFVKTDAFLSVRENDLGT